MNGDTYLHETIMAHKQRKSSSLDSIDVLLSRHKRYLVKAPCIQLLAALICEAVGLKGWELCIRFVGKSKIRELNDLHRGKDYVTDVLSFPQLEWEKPLRVRALAKGKSRPILGESVLGDIVICLEYAQKNAVSIGQGIDREICFLLVHGILHLCGHDHEKKAEERIMLADQRKIMSFLDNDKVWKNCVRIR